MSEIAAPERPSQPLIATDLHPGTQACYRWAVWQTQHSLGLPIKVALFRKEGARLAVHDYGGSQCAVLTLADVKPRVREFREWREPYATVMEKLVARGWSLVSEIAAKEVNHVH